MNDADVQDASSADESGTITEAEELLAAVEQIDYSRYESPQLRESIEAILSVGGTIKCFLRAVFFSFPICQLLIMWAFSDKGWLTYAMAILAGLVVSMLLAVLLGITLCLRRILNEAVRVIDRTLDIVGSIIADMGATTDRGLIATSASVFGGVSRNLVMPIVQSVLQAQLGYLSWPILWLYRRVLLRAVDIATSRILLAATSIKFPGQERMKDTAGHVGGQLEAGAKTADWLLATIRPYVIGGSRAFNSAILIPAWIILSVVALGAMALAWALHAFTPTPLAVG
jgi:hypothetical protein